MFAQGEDGQVHFAEARALTPEDLAAVQQQVRARLLRCPLLRDPPTCNRAPNDRITALRTGY